MSGASLVWLGFLWLPSPARAVELTADGAALLATRAAPSVAQADTAADQARGAVALGAFGFVPRVDLRAGYTRLRPILMTTAAMVFGMLPVAMGQGDGGEIRSAMGIIVIGGLLTSTVLTLVVVPVLNTFMDRVSELALGLVGRRTRAHPPEEVQTVLAS